MTPPRPTEQLAPLAPLADLMRSLAWRRGVSRALAWAVPSAGVALGVALALGRWAPGVPRAVALAALLPSLWPVAGAGRALQRDPLGLALAVDRRLSADAAVVSAAELALTAASDRPLEARVRADALAALAGRRPRDVLDPLDRREKRSILAVLAAALMAVAVPVPARSHAPPRPVARVQSPAAAEQARRLAESLETAALHDPLRAASLRAAAEQARTLAERLDQGTDRDRALTDLDALQREMEQNLAWARDAQHRAAVDAALAELNEPDTRALRDALSRGDMRAVDEAARALADRQEAASLQRAERALARAADAAREHGGGDLAHALDEEGGLLRRRSQSSALSRAIAQALARPELAQRVSEHLSRGGDGDHARALEEAMRAIDGQLTADERRRLAEAMARMATAAEPESRAAMEQAGRAATPEEMRAAMEALVRQLRDGSLERTQAGAAAQAGATAQAQLGQVRMSLRQGGAPGGAPGSGQGNTPGSGSEGPGGPGGSHDPGHIASSGHSQTVQRPGFVAPAAGMTDPTHPGLPIGEQRTDTTGTRTQGPMDVQLREAAPSAVRGVEHTPMPAGFRDQVRTYFNP